MSNRKSSFSLVSEEVARRTERKARSEFAGSLVFLIITLSVVVMIIVGSYFSSGWTNADMWGISDLIVCVTLALASGLIGGLVTYYRYEGL